MQIKEIIVKEISVEELKALFDNNAEIELFDIREDWEKEMADIGGKLIPLSQVEQRKDEFPRNKKSIIYCRSGRRSVDAIKIIGKNRSTDNLYNLTGGILAWADKIDSSVKKY